MAFQSLREFIARLDAEGELARISEPVSPILEIAEITDRVSKSSKGGKALLFESVEGSSIPVLINAFGSWRRIQIALGVNNLDAIAKDIERFTHLTPPSTFADKIRFLPMLLETARIPPVMVSSKEAACQEVVLTGDEIDLNQIPILQCWPRDAGRFITFPIVINRSINRKIRNVGLYRMQIFDKKTTAMHWHIHKDGAHFFHEFKRKKQIMGVAVAIGCDPATCYAASAPLPYGVDEFLLAGFLRKEPVPLVKCKTLDLEVPANAEIVLEGFIDPEKSRIEGPFGDHTGYYSQDGDYPVFHVTAITHRRHPIYLTTIVGIPPQEDYYLGKATERIFLPLLRLHLPEIVDMNMPLEGVFHNCIIISIDKRYPMQARRLMSALWGIGQMSFLKTIVVVDADINVHDNNAVLNLLLNKTNLERDTFFAEGILDVLNHASDHALFGSKVGLDATTKVKGEPGYNETSSGEPVEIPNIRQEVLSRFSELTDCQILKGKFRHPVLLTTLNKTRPKQAVELIREFFQNDTFISISILIVLEGHINLENHSQVLWKFFANLDPRRDIQFINDRIGIDVTQKFPEEGHTQTWPEEILMTEDIRSHVDEKWNRLFKTSP